MKLMHLCRLVNKQRNETCNYAKGEGNVYQTFHPGKQYLPIVRDLSGARQDAAFEGALPIYDAPPAPALDATPEARRPDAPPQRLMSHQDRQSIWPSSFCFNLFECHLADDFGDAVYFI